ncbi:hypothetical protein CYY_006168 [Polysphondylium violaceum]|uniref:Major facilitator superfamily (MFS) profile domain-containing protein n=1 Tax=Polysphondylium violaceum TaxID=133409 RepID=A0A8J4UYC9_9MYCE|nr:hypothetical protein CYY_006168 [Polysphondylium violaceum]
MKHVDNPDNSIVFADVNSNYHMETSSDFSEIDDRPIMDRIGSSRALIITLSAMGGLIFGYNTGVIGPALDALNKIWHFNTVQQGLIACSTLLGATFGSVGGGFMADKIGRRPMVLLTGLCTIAGAISSAAIRNMAISAPLRIILGLGVGCSSTVCPLMVAEAVPIEKRGKFGSVFQLFVTIGLLLSNVMGVLLMKAPHNWQWLYAAGAAPGFALLPIWLLMKESPVFLERKRREKELEQQRIENGTAHEVVPKKSRYQILREPRNRKPMFLGVVLAVFSQLTGINAFMYFSSIIFEFAGFDGLYGPRTCASILQFWNVSWTVIAMFTVDKVGRRILLFSGSIVMTVSDLLLALFFVVFTGGKVQGWLCIVMLFTFVAAFAMSIGTLFWFVIGEIMDDDVKDISTPIIVALQWVFNLILTFVFLSAVRYIGKSTMFWIFGGIGVVCVFLLATFLPPEQIKKDGDLTAPLSPGTDLDPDTFQDVSPSIFSKDHFHDTMSSISENLRIDSPIPRKRKLPPSNLAQ